MDEQEGRLGHQSFLAMTEFILLIKSVMKQRNISAAYLARKTGLHKSKVSRGLSGSSPIDLPSIHLLFLALDIDSHRALLAVGRFGDWKRYYDPDIEVLSGLLEELPQSLAAARDGGERVAIGPGGIKKLASQISAVIAENDRRVCERRNSFSFEGELRRAG